MPASPSPTSWRDVYTLIQDVEERLTKRMDAAATERRATSTDVEVRLRVLEAARLTNAQADSTAKNVVSVARSTAVVFISAMAAVISLLALFIHAP